MREDIENRVIEEAKYIIETKCTVRVAGKVFHMGKSTVHKDVSERLEDIDKDMFDEVKKILNVNLAERHVRGGEATRQKYLLRKKISD